MLTGTDTLKEADTGRVKTGASESSGCFQSNYKIFRSQEHPEILMKRTVYTLELKEACKRQGWIRDELQEKCDTKSQENVMWTCSFPRRCGRWNCSGAVPCTHLRQISSSSIPAGMQLHYCCYTASHKYFGATGSLKNAMSTEIGCSLVIRMFIWWSSNRKLSETCSFPRISNPTLEATEGSPVYSPWVAAHCATVPLQIL